MFRYLSFKLDDNIQDLFEVIFTCILWIEELFFNFSFLALSHSNPWWKSEDFKT